MFIDSTIFADYRVFDPEISMMRLKDLMLSPLPPAPLHSEPISEGTCFKCPYTIIPVHDFALSGLTVETRQ